MRLIQLEVKNLICFIGRLVDDIQEISSKFNIKNKIIENIKITNSDRHNFQGPVIFVVFNDNFKIVYKSKNMDTDICLRKIIDKNYFSHTSYYWIKTKINSINDDFIKNREIEIKIAVR